MSRKSLWVLAGLIALCPGLQAQNTPPASDKPDPRFEAFYGIWELVPEETTLYNAKDQIMQELPQPGGFTELSMMYANGTQPGTTTVNLEVHPCIFDGKPHQSYGADPRQMTCTLIDSHTFERAFPRPARGDRPAGVAHYVSKVSADGMKMTITMNQPGVPPDQTPVRTFRKRFGVTVSGALAPTFQTPAITQDPNFANYTNNPGNR
jgi:hypothetical protein